jgi:hypothetical protein
MGKIVGKHYLRIVNGQTIGKNALYEVRISWGGVDDLS